MCGVFGIIGNENVVPSLLKGLLELEYRGYDSSGIATLNKDNKIELRRCVGRVEKLIESVNSDELSSHIAIGHTRWATHGQVNISNAHPHKTDEVAVVHNGNIENFVELRRFLSSNGIYCETDTDTEVIPKLVTLYLHKGMSPMPAVQKAMTKIDGSFAILLLFSSYDNLMIAAKNDNSLVIGLSENGVVISSDTNSISCFVDEAIYLQNNDIVSLQKSGFEVFNNNALVQRNFCKLDRSGPLNVKHNFTSHMIKEIYEQPDIIEGTIEHYLQNSNIKLPYIPQIDSIDIVGCGSSYFAGCIAKYWFEKLAGVCARPEIASEVVLSRRHSKMAIFVSQSGETKDTIKALEHIKSGKDNHFTVGLVNVKNSVVGTSVDYTLENFAGCEKSVASTKVFMTQMIVLLCFAIFLGEKRKMINKMYSDSLIKCLYRIPNILRQVIDEQSQNIKDITIDILKYRSVIYIGRGTFYGIAQEGALKLKEIAYIHSEGMPAGELKHGSLALVDKDVLIIALLPSNDVSFPKMLLNVEQILSRDGDVIVITDENGKKALEKKCKAVISVPLVDSTVAPIVYTLVIQLIAYYTGVHKGNNIDYPRSLAKSVTIE